MNDELVRKIKNLNVGKVEDNVLLSKYTTYRVGGPAICVVYPKNVTCLVKLLRFLKLENVMYKMLGNGSNLLFSDKPYNGVLIKLDEFNNIEFLGKNKVRVGAGVSLVKLSLLTAKKGFTGLEFASGIPGSIGGAVFMNAGAYKSDMGYIVEKVKVLTPDLKIIYLEVILKLQKGSRDAIEEVIRERRKRRIESQPLEYPSAGSVFRNPEGDFAGRLVEEAGLKGMKHGGAMISDKHANFVVNYKKAKAEDIKYLIDLAHDKIKENYGVNLKIEQEFVNWE